MAEASPPAMASRKRPSPNDLHRLHSASTSTSTSTPVPVVFQPASPHPHAFGSAWTTIARSLAPLHRSLLPEALRILSFASNFIHSDLQELLVHKLHEMVSVAAPHAQGMTQNGATSATQFSGAVYVAQAAPVDQPAVSCSMKSSERSGDEEMEDARSGMSSELMAESMDWESERRVTCEVP